MNVIRKRRITSLHIAGFIAVLFGLLTIKSGGAVLFIDGIDRKSAGQYVPFVLWFNFFAGFLYLAAGAGLFMKQRWAVWLALFILISTLIVFALFGLHIVKGGAYEVRTVAAMSLRSVVWAVMSGVAWYKIGLK